MLNHEPSVDNVFYALADPTRRAIVKQLSRGDASVSEIARPLDMSLAAVVQHVQVLEECGVIRTRKLGRVRTCRVDTQALALVEQWLSDRRTLWERNFDRLGAVLEERKAVRSKKENR
ncbi:MAG TPA: metalloregulator ArsR/SmtB family transcription factor [Rudaea sp.]